MPELSRRVQTFTDSVIRRMTRISDEVGAITSLFMSYIVIMLMIVYFCSLIFFKFEQAVNPQVDTYWTSLWWAAMNMSTVGCYINPVTDTGRVLAVVLPISGMIIFPLFTVYLTDYVKRHGRPDVK